MGRAFVLLFLLLAAAPAWAEPVIVRFQVDVPRAFGYVIGDLVERRVTAEVASPYRLRKETLPEPGRLGPWLELRRVEVKERRGFTTNRYEIGLIYQVLNSPEALKVLSLPTVPIEFTDGAQRSVAREVPAWAFTVAPVVPGEPVVLQGLGEMRPDVPPRLIATGPYWSRLALYGAGIVAILLYLAYAYIGLPFVARSNGPFARAYRDIRASLRRGGTDTLHVALRRIHRALDETAGATMFGERLGEFFARHPRYADLRDDTERFFRLSQHEFFGVGAAAPETRSVAWLLAFCRDWRDRERGVA